MKTDSEPTGKLKRALWKKTLVCLLPICLIAAGLLMTGAITGSGVVEESRLAGNPLKGRNLFVSKGCIKCHAAWGVGGRAGPDLSRVGMGKSLLQIAGALWSHSPEMIEAMDRSAVQRPAITPEEMSDFISYLYYINYYNEPGSAAAGRRLFSEKGCADCHSIEGDGGRGGPALDDYRRHSTALFIAQAMWNHGPRMAEVMRASGVEKPYFRGREAADLLAFIRGQTADEIAGDKFMLPGSPASGGRLFAQKGCAGCHSTGGGGKSTGVDLSKTASYKSVVEIAGAMWNHGPEIWAQMQKSGITRPTFGGSEMADIVSYLYFLRYAESRGDRVTGKRLFASKGCAGCHSAPSDLGQSAALASAINLMSAMWNHAPTMAKLAEEKGLPWPAFQGDEMRDLVEYVKSSAGSAKKAK
jgi:mono/diheme cytochrome c family protein